MNNEKADREFIPRVRGHYDGDDYNFCFEQWEQAPFERKISASDEYEFLSVIEHETLMLEERTKLKHEIMEIASRSYSGDWQRWFAVKEFLESI